MTEFPPTAGPGDPSAAGGTHIKVECVELIVHLWTLLDGEVTDDFTPETREKLLKHLEDCPPCEELHGLGERLKALIASKCRGEKAPEGLRERLRLEISRTTIIRR